VHSHCALADHSRLESRPSLFKLTAKTTVNKLASNKMPRCEGLPNSPCPSLKEDSTVKLSQGDLMLCPVCRETRFPNTARQSGENQQRSSSLTPKATHVVPASNDIPSDTATPVTIANLESLSTLPDEELHDAFIASMDSIFAYSLGDIQASLNKFSKECLAKLHKSLSEKVSKAFTQFKNRKPINRQVKHTLINDISVMGYSLVNTSPLKDVEKIFHHLNPTTSEGTDVTTIQPAEVAELITSVATLSCKLVQLEKEVKELRNLLHATTVDKTAAAHLPSSSESDENEDHDDEIEDMLGFQHQRKQRKKARRHQRRLLARAKTASQQPVNSGDPPAITPTIPVSQPAPTATPPSQPNARPSDANTSPVVAAELTSPVEAARSPSPVEAARPVSPMSAVYIGGVKHTNSTDDIRRHLSNIGVSQCGKLDVLSDNPDWKSFKIEILKGDVDKVCNLDAWPPGIKARPFHARQHFARHNQNRQAPGPRSSAGTHQRQQHRSSRFCREGRDDLRSNSNYRWQHTGEHSEPNQQQHWRRNWSNSRQDNWRQRQWGSSSERSERYQ